MTVYFCHLESGAWLTNKAQIPIGACQWPPTVYLSAVLPGGYSLLEETKRRMKKAIKLTDIERKKTNGEYGRNTEPGQTEEK